LEESGIYTIDEKGNLAAIGNREISVEHKVRTWKGTNPLSLVVNSDYYASLSGRRFNLNAYGDPSLVAPVVVGISKEQTEPSLSSQIAELSRKTEDRFEALSKQIEELAKLLRPT
jgi:hypothetical protein